MLQLLAHVTPNESPYGVLLFAAGWAAGLASAAISAWLPKSLIVYPLVPKVRSIRPFASYWIIANFPLVEPPTSSFPSNERMMELARSSPNRSVKTQPLPRSPKVVSIAPFAPSRAKANLLSRRGEENIAVPVMTILPSGCMTTS